MLQISNFINGRHAPPASGRYLDNLEPATGQVYSQLADSDSRDVDAAVQAALDAFPNWSRTPAAERSRLLLDVAGRIEANLERLAQAESVDSGKPLRLARTIDIPRAASNFRFFATAILHSHSEAYRTDQLALNYVLRQPRGVAGLISPWNLPLYLFTWKVAPALATGNTAVAKPSELTPMTAHLLTEMCQDILPPGVFNVVHGLGAKVGAAIVSHPRVPTLSFTGGTATGAEIARTAAPLFKKVALELGGKNPNVIFADADLDQALAVSLRSSFENQGEICLCGSRIYVEKSLYPRFVDRFVAETRKLRAGDPLDTGTDLGALISKTHFDKVMSYVRLAQEAGGRILCGGGPPQLSLGDRCRGGSFVQPTVIVDLPAGCRVDREEIFGPVVTIAPFANEEEALACANGTPYGLSATLWTQDLNRAHRLAEKLETGTVWVNCWLLRDLRVPFGGMKQSGVGREGGEEALRFFTEPKNVCIKFPAEAT
jgi:aminomuconate-semialdehyde/2-hydroxymuconate-6-semialdehyde dehydrogenase